MNVEKFESTLHHKEQLASRMLDSLAHQIDHISIKKRFIEAYERYQALWENEGIVLLGYENDSLKFWNNNKIPIDLQLSAGSFHSPVIKLNNGYYKVEHLEYRKRQYYALILLKSEYAFENDFLINQFQSDFNLSERSKFVFDDSEDLPQIHARNGDYLFSLKFKKYRQPPAYKYFILVFIYLLGFISLLVFLNRIRVPIARKIGDIGALAIFIVAIAGLRLLMLEYNFPTVFFELEVFNPAYYGTSFLFPSLGDLLINAILLLVIAYFLDRKISNRRSKDRSAFARYNIAIFSIVFLFVYATFNTHLFQGLVKDSNIQFDVTNLFTLDWYSYIGILVIGIILLSFFVFANKLVGLIKSLQVSAREFSTTFALVTLIYLISNYAFGERDLILLIWPALILLVIAFTHYRNEGKFEFSNVVVMLIVFALFSSHTVFKFSIKKERENRQVFVEKLSSDEDPVAEWEYPSLERKILASDLITLPFDSTVTFSKSEFDKQIRQKFFVGYWDKYEVTSAIFGPDSLPVTFDAKTAAPEFSQLEKTIRLYGTKTNLSPNLIYIHNSSQKLSYIIRLPLVLGESEAPYGFLYFNLASKLIPEELGFPTLLLGNNTRKIEDLSNYSFAKYVDKRLISRSGDFHYPISLRLFETIQGTPPFYEYDEYSHLFYHADENTLVILSKPIEDVVGQITSFSYLFALFSMILILVIFFNKFPEGLRIEALHLKTKVQLLLVGILVTTLILFVIGTRYYIESQYKVKHNNLISEKINSVQIEMLNKLGSERELGPDLVDYMTFYLRKFSGVFFTDINLYAPNGDLLASSRQKIFDEGLISRKMNPEAYLQIGINERSKFIHEEEIGNMRYLSAYIPFRNKYNENLGYLNLPYFARQGELENEISTFLVAIINIFVLLFGFSIVGALFVSNWITKPLRLLQESLATVELGKINRQIHYEGSDEIGSLVAQYNKMVDELQQNASLLAKSERESAWREMAKQVAHEIKNPLTPIKLRTQHLQMAYDRDDPKWDERFRNYTTMLIEQIDTLTHIANEFSNFAKMPKAQEEKIDLTHLLKSVVELFQDVDSAEVSYASNLVGPEYVLADRDQLTRSFTNLVKNATQAIPDNEEGKVQLILTVVEEGYQIEVRDNGSGIPNDQLNKIFTPNFTTKSTGMGLGLSMVKQIVENANGSIRFKTKLNRGTSFFVNLPFYSET